MSQVVIENPIIKINSPFNDAGCLGVPTLDEASFKKLISKKGMR